jgi:polygalacturonase
MVAAGLPPEQRIVPEYGRLRSAFVEPYACTNVLIQGVTLHGSRFWQLHPTLCRNVTVDSVHTGDTTQPNTDGCNPESCDHVVIRRCTFDAFDDCIALKSGRDEDGRRVNTPCENVVITGCMVQGPAGGIAVGSEMTGGIRNVFLHDIVTSGRSVHHMLYAKSNTRRGGYAVNLNVDSVSADHLSGAWAFAQMDYDGQRGGFRPQFRDWTISNSTGRFVPLAFQLSGLSDDPIAGLHVHDCDFANVFFPVDLYDNVEDVTFAGVTINGWSVDR